MRGRFFYLLILLLGIVVVGCGHQQLSTYKNEGLKQQDTSLNRIEDTSIELNDIDTTKFAIQYLWNKEPYIADGSSNHVIKISFLDKKTRKLISSFDVINSNPYLEYSFPAKSVQHPQDYCYLPYDLSLQREQQHPVFFNSDNVILQCPFVTTTNNLYTAISYNAICRSGEWPFKYLSNLIVLSNHGETVFKSSNLQTSCEGMRISSDGNFLMYHYESFNTDDDYPDEQGIKLVSINNAFKLKDIDIESEYPFIKPYLISSKPKMQGNIVLGLFNFDTYELMIKEIPFSSYDQIKITKTGLLYSLPSVEDKQEKGKKLRFDRDFNKVTF